MNETSVASYWEGKHDGTFNRQSLILLESLRAGPCTRNELSVRSGVKIAAVCGRINALIERGVVEEHGKTLDAATQRNVWVLRIKEV